MSLLERIMQSPELQANPPVLVDVGAAGGVSPVWRRLARYSIGIGFEPDARDADKLDAANTVFRRWIYCAGLVAPSVENDGRKTFYLTKSPHCSSLLRPRNDRLKDWLFADYFMVEKITTVPAVTLEAALTSSGVRRIDWLKCDTQGQDLSIFMSLPEAWRRRMLAVEFEPGLIDAYEGEDKFWHTLRAMENEPFWISNLEVCHTQRGDPEALRSRLGGKAARWLSKLAPGAPGWVNVRYLRNIRAAGEELDRRGLLLAWVFADILKQHTHGLMVAEEGLRRFGPDLFGEMLARSSWGLRWSMLRRVPGWLRQRLGLGA
jgi:FkbM family methyltransferase